MPPRGGLSGLWGAAPQCSGKDNPRPCPSGGPFCFVVFFGVAIIIICGGLPLELVGHVLCTSGVQVSWKTFGKLFFESFFWTSVGPSCVALPRSREDGEEDCREDAAEDRRIWISNGPRTVQDRSWRSGGLLAASGVPGAPRGGPR